MFLFCLVFAMSLCASVYMCFVVRSPAGKGLTSWLSFVVSAVGLSLTHWYPGSFFPNYSTVEWTLRHKTISLGTLRSLSESW